MLGCWNAGIKNAEDGGQKSEIGKAEGERLRRLEGEKNAGMLLS